MVCCHDPEILNNFEQGTELTFSFSTRPKKIMWPILSLLKWHHYYPCHWNQPPGRTHPGFSLPSFPHLIMLFHAKQGITFPPFKELTSTCPLIITQDSSIAEILTAAQSGTDAPLSSFSSSSSDLHLSLCPRMQSCLSPPNDCEPLDGWFYFLFISCSQPCTWHIQNIF